MEDAFTKLDSISEGRDRILEAREQCYMSSKEGVFIFCCCPTNCHKFSSLKYTHLLSHSSGGQNWHSMSHSAGFLFQVSQG